MSTVSALWIIYYKLSQLQEIHIVGVTHRRSHERSLSQRVPTITYFPKEGLMRSVYWSPPSTNCSTKARWQECVSCSSCYRSLNRNKTVTGMKTLPRAELWVGYSGILQLLHEFKYISNDMAITIKNRFIWKPHCS